MWCVTVLIDFALRQTFFFGEWLSQNIFFLWVNYKAPLVIAHGFLLETKAKGSERNREGRAYVIRFPLFSWSLQINLCGNVQNKMWPSHCWGNMNPLPTLCFHVSVSGLMDVENRDSKRLFRAPALPTLTFPKCPDKLLLTVTVSSHSLQYIHPADSVKLGQAELVVIDEAAAIPLPLVKNLLGPYLVFMASTING